MSLLAPLVLARDVLLTPLAELDADTRANIDGADDDVAVSRPASRQPSVVVDSQAAALLGLFREPSTVADAVIRFSRPRALDPDDVLTSAFPLVQRFFASRVLEPAAADGTTAAAAELAAGAEIGPWRVVRVLARLDDVEVVQARDAGERLAALKVARTVEGGMAAATLDAETAVLTHLAATAPGLAPAPRGRGLVGERAYLALEWCSGVDLAAAAAEARDDGPAAVAALLAGVAAAYARLHEAGACHGDVHPRNLLVDGQGSVRLLDFGLARLAIGTSPPPRGGVPFYFEPEYAQAQLAGETPPPATPAGEAYSVAALLYEAATGKPYLDFRLGREDLLEQIATQPPLPFAARGTTPWPELEAVLARGLAKSAAERFATTRALAEALAAVAPPPSGTVAGPSPDALDRFVATLAEAAAEDGPWQAQGLPAPTASVNYGAAGIALGLLHLAERRGDPVLLARAEAWLERAEAARDAEDAFFAADIEITREVVGEASPYHSPAGLAAVRARLARSRGDVAGQAAAVRAFVELSRRPAAGDDLTLGRSATILGAALVLAALPAGSAERSAVLALGREQLAAVWSRLDREPEISRSALDNLGIAHGWAGFAYSALQWHRASGDPVPGGLPRRLDELAALAEPAGRGLEWRWQLQGDRLAMPGWCNGSAGHTLLWTLVHQVRGDQRALELATGAGWNVWESPKGASTTLCCGLAGRGYALLALYRASGEARWLTRARELARAGVRQAGQDPTYAHALWKGDLGLATLIADLDAPEHAALPWFEAEAW